MHRRHNKFLIISFIGLIILGVYSYFYNNLKSEAADSAITSSLTTPQVTSQEGSDQAANDTAFLMKLATLTKIKVDTTLFSDNSFKLLVDNNIQLEPVPYGRKNPFSRADMNVVMNTNNRVASFSIKTTPATSITAKSAVLNGSIDGATSDNIYFEYGPTATFGKVTPKVTQSLIGSFSSNLTALNPKTTIYYRAVANINGVMSYGNIMSFNTN